VLSRAKGVENLLSVVKGSALLFSLEERPDPHFCILQSASWFEGDRVKRTIKFPYSIRKRPGKSQSANGLCGVLLPFPYWVKNPPDAGGRSGPHGGFLVAPHSTFPGANGLHKYRFLHVGGTAQFGIEVFLPHYWSIAAWAIISNPGTVPPLFFGYDSRAFMEDLASRLKNRIQLSSDGLSSYADAVDNAFGSEVDYPSRIRARRIAEA